jgi:peptidoglycan/xylan/chitin deacetylase (PgdA/CDA1 family)
MGVSSLNIFGLQRGSVIFIFNFISTLITFIILVNIPSSFSQEISKNGLSCNCVVFRFDDIQDHFLNRSQIAIMDLFLEKNQTLSLALILNYLGNDTSVVHKVLHGYETGNFELDSHGWNHENFSKIDESTQIDLLKKANKKLYYLFGVNTTVFIPPFYEFDNLTLNAMGESGMTIISSFDRIYAQRNQSDLITNLMHPNLEDNNKIIHFPNTAIHSYDDGRIWKTHSTEQVLGEIERSISTYGYAVTTLHPQAFVPMQNGTMINTVNTTQLNNLESLLDSIESSHIQTTNFKDLSQIILKNPVTVTSSK